jgi:four helix bundle protein
MMGVHSFYELRAWQSARTFKLAIYRLIGRGTLAKDLKLREQLRESARSAASHVAEGYGRFYPADFARFLGMAKASVIEAQNHLQDAVDCGHITDDTRIEHQKLAQVALADVTSLLEYLQSPKAAENARRVRERRQARRRRTATNEPRTDEPRTNERRTDEPRTNEPRTNEPRTENPERRTG